MCPLPRAARRQLTLLLVHQDGAVGPGAAIALHGVAVVAVVVLVPEGAELHHLLRCRHGRSAGRPTPEAQPLRGVPCSGAHPVHPRAGGQSSGTATGPCPDRGHPSLPIGAPASSPQVASPLPCPVLNSRPDQRQPRPHHGRSPCLGSQHPRSSAPPLTFLKLVHHLDLEAALLARAPLLLARAPGLALHAGAQVLAEPQPHLVGGGPAGPVLGRPRPGPLPRPHVPGPLPPTRPLPGPRARSPATLASPPSS